ncbi:exonuclease SbcCD subunit D C-terminal domain-containing protein [Desulfoprunum benzoelyticum]|uniref:exonuclease SbcCD subunit D C-terminal domain-containing protein n=1 Tax=Desulfoprunum benzoelyticum TaxID=1506996 RepID=UPI001610187E|nr:exonuclease SbcCD subunit D C-terminal domain-containing protein [Desulfoprunum benzoelyticum]
MTILHTSDWHIGRTLYGRRRYREFEAFLHWLADLIEEERIDVLLVAGDVFDTSTPSNRAQELYYRFLCRVAASPCRHVVVVAGNHDSPSFLNAPRQLLRALHIHVVGTIGDQIGDEVVVLNGLDGAPELIVCAVPYLRDRDIRIAEAGESLEDKDLKLIRGIRGHYAEVAAVAEDRRRIAGGDIPIVAMGHLFTAGGRTLEGDGVRDLYVGSLAHLSASIFPAAFDYLALGHLHVPQEVGGSPCRRYSGSPLAMGFGEAGQEKSLCLVRAVGRDLAVELVPVPRFQRLARLHGDWGEIVAGLRRLAAECESIWLEVVYDGDEIISDLRRRLEEEVAGTAIEILRVRNPRVMDRALSRIDDEESLDDLQVDEVFERCLTLHAVPASQRPQLLQSYREIVAALAAADVRVE